jgi:DNA-binding transcriptional LysR family regulator
MPSSGEHWDARIGRRIRLRDLHVLLTVVQRGSMAKAAQHLSVTQPAVSKSIADLEHALGVRLLDRSPQGIEPTIYGHALVRRGLSVFDELRQGVGEIEFMADPHVGEVRVGCPETLAATLLPAVVERLSKQHPGVRLYVAQTNPLTLEIRELRDRNVDLMLGRMGPAFTEEDLNAEILYHDPLVVVAGAQSRWARCRVLDLAELVDEKWILYPPKEIPGIFIEEAFRSRGLNLPPASVLTYSFQLRDMLLMTGNYLSIVAASAVPILNAKRVIVKSLPIDLGNQAKARPVAIFTLKNRTLSPVTELFIECVRTAAKTISSQPKGRR